MSPAKGEKVIRTACNSHCGGRCLLNVHVKDGVITRVETDDIDDSRELQLRACLRCRAYRQRVYDPDRLKYPMKRVGERGEGKFERITWDEALETIAKQYIRIRDTYGPASFMLLGGGGDSLRLHRYDLLGGLFSQAGGYTPRWGNPSFEGGQYAAFATYGTIDSVNDFDDIVNARLIIMWGWNPAVTIHDCNTTYLLAQTKEKGVPIISIDPRYHESAAIFADKWIPLIPGTDTAMLVAMAHVIISENLQDQKFLDKYTVGFDKFKEYVMGKEDGIAKTPTWAEKITGVPAKTIADLARQYATTKPAALVAGIGPGRAAYGEQYHRAAQVLAAMTGNVGVHGGWGCRSHAPPYFGGYDFKLGRGPQPKVPGNPVERSAKPRKTGLPTLRGGAELDTRIHLAHIADAILRGKAAGYPADIKMLFVMHTNPVNQAPNANKVARAFRSPNLEFFAVAEQMMTATARFADILLPTSTFMERNDVTTGGASPFFGYAKKLIEPLYESKSPLDICRLLAVKLGFPNYIEKGDEEWVADMVKGSRLPEKEIGTFVKEGVYRLKLPETRVAFKEQIDDLAKHPFETPSGKMEIYSSKLAAMDDPLIPPIPKYIPAWENRDDALSKKYPLQLVTTHFKRRAHTQFDHVPWLRELVPQAVQINTGDAQARSIKDGEMVRVFNDRGQMLLPARVTQRIMPGVVDIPEGAWYKPDENGVDRGGCTNVLTRDEPSPGGAFCYNTNLVQVERT